MTELSVAAHFSFDGTDIAARGSGRYAFLQHFIENATMIRLLVPRGK